MGTIALINMRNVSALLKELQRPHKTLLPRRQQSNPSRLQMRLLRTLPLPLAKIKDARAKAGERAKGDSIDKHRLVWREFLHQPLVTLT